MKDERKRKQLGENPFRVSIILIRAIHGFLHEWTWTLLTTPVWSQSYHLPGSVQPTSATTSGQFIKTHIA
jgi:hypothetical protein